MVGITSIVDTRAVASRLTKPNEVHVFNSSGQRLPTFFDGVPSDPQNSWELLMANRNRPRCGGTVAEYGLLRSLGDALHTAASDLLQYVRGNTNVYAAPCPTAACAGTRLVYDFYECFVTMYCLGTVQNPSYDPQSGDPCKGSCRDGTHCGLDPSCGCHQKLCNSCAIPTTCP